MLKKIAKFIKYNTLAAVIIAIAFVAVASAMADEETRNKVIGEEIVEKSGVDNTALLAADLDNFDMEMKITGAMEDPPEIEDGNYYIDYQYKTLAIKDNVWQEVLVKKQMVVSKKSLAGRDLGLYVKEELGEIIDYQLAYLKKVQDSEAEKGRTVVLETTEYTGLIGMVLDTKTKELPGYEPVVKPVEPEIKEDDGNTINEEFEEKDIENGKLDIEEESPPASPSQEPSLTSPSQGEEKNYPAGAPVWEQMEKNCLNNGGFWYNDTCNAEEEIVEEEAVNEEPKEEQTEEQAEEEPMTEELPAEEPASEELAEEEPSLTPPSQGGEEADGESVTEPETETETETTEPKTELEQEESS